jgi:hypothetical protein
MLPPYFTKKKKNEAQQLLSHFPQGHTSSEFISKPRAYPSFYTIPPGDA